MVTIATSVRSDHRCPMCGRNLAPGVSDGLFPRYLLRAGRTCRNPFPMGVYLNGVVFSNGQFVAVSNKATVMGSGDRANWVLRQSSTKNSFHEKPPNTM